MKLFMAKKNNKSSEWNGFRDVQIASGTDNSQTYKLVNLPSLFMCLDDRVVSKWIRGRVFDLHSPGRKKKKKIISLFCLFNCLWKR